MSRSAKTSIVPPKPFFPVPKRAATTVKITGFTRFTNHFMAFNVNGTRVALLLHPTSPGDHKLNPRYEVRLLGKYASFKQAPSVTLTYDGDPAEGRAVLSGISHRVWIHHLNPHLRSKDGSTVAQLTALLLQLRWDSAVLERLQQSHWDHYDRMKKVSGS